MHGRCGRGGRAEARERQYDSNYLLDQKEPINANRLGGNRKRANRTTRHTLRIVRKVSVRLARSESRQVFRNCGRPKLLASFATTVIDRTILGRCTICSHVVATALSLVDLRRGHVRGRPSERIVLELWQKGDLATFAPCTYAKASL